MRMVLGQGPNVGTGVPGPNPEFSWVFISLQREAAYV